LSLDTVTEKRYIMVYDEVIVNRSGHNVQKTLSNLSEVLDQAMYKISVLEDEVASLNAYREESKGEKNGYVES
jgi:hypothetical protein